MRARLQNTNVAVITCEHTAITRRSERIKRVFISLKQCIYQTVKSENINAIVLNIAQETSYASALTKYLSEELVEFLNVR